MVLLLYLSINLYFILWFLYRLNSMTQLFEPWLEYKHTMVRHLAFCLASPNIIQSIPVDLDIQYPFELHHSLFWQQQYLRYQPRLQQLDQNPQALIDFIAPLKSTRLGLRFEYLLWFWLNDHQYHDYQVLGHSIQIIQAKQTIGELDFLLFNTITQQIEHWEVALKFYLAEADFSLKHWYGLNRTDTLYKKLQHFTTRQFQFKTVNNHTIQKRFVILKGQLYLPESIGFNPTQHDKLPDWINSARQLGTWGEQIINPDFYRLKRQEWICTDLKQSSSPATFWANGLYQNQRSKHNYMFRQASILYRYVKK